MTAWFHWHCVKMISAKKKNGKINVIISKEKDLYERKVARDQTCASARFLKAGLTMYFVFVGYLMWCEWFLQFCIYRILAYWQTLYWLWASLVLVPIRNVMLWHLVQFDRQHDRTGVCVCAVFSSMALSALAHPLPNTHWSPSGSLYTSLIAAHQLLIGWPLASWRFPRASKVRLEFRTAFTGWNEKAEMIW